MRANDTVRHSAVLAFLALVVAACGGKDAQQANNAPAREIQLAILAMDGFAPAPGRRRGT